MAKAAFLTYNTVGENGDWPNGVHERNGHTAIIVSHPRGQRWGASEAVDGLDPVYQNPKLAPEGTDEREAQRQAFGNERRKLVADLYAGFLDQHDLDELDYVVVYVGTGGSEGAIALAARAGAEKARFVLCDCNLDEKIDEIGSHFENDVPFLVCECGGRSTMEKLVNQFLQTGVVAR